MGVRKLSTASIKSNNKSTKFWDGNVGTFESIATFYLTSPAGSVTFSSIPTAYKHLQIRIISENIGGSNYNFMRFNSDTASNYYNHFTFSVGSSTPSGSYLNSSSLYTGQSFAGDNTYWGVSITDILDYNDTNKYKTIKTVSGESQNGSGLVLIISGYWSNTNAITSIEFKPQLGGNFRTNSRFALYGIRGV